MRAAARITCPVALRRATRSGVTGVQVVRRRSQTTSSGDQGEDHEQARGIVRELADEVRPARHSAAEEVGRGGAEQPASRDGIAGVAALLFQVADRLGPAVLGVRAGRPVVERLLALPPPPLEGDPRELDSCGGRIAGDDGDNGTHVVGRAAGVIAAEPLLAGRAEVEGVVVVVGVRAGGRVHDWMSAVDDLELRVVPLGDLEPFVLAVADLDGCLVERLRGIRSREDELDHLPVALVLVGEVVERVEEPVLHGDPVIPTSLGRDVGVGRRRGARADGAGPLLVVTARLEWVAGEVQVVAVETRAEILGRRAGLDHVVFCPRPAQCHAGVTQNELDVAGLIGLPGPALDVLVDQPNHRREPLGEGLFGLVGRAGGAHSAGSDGRAGAHAA